MRALQALAFAGLILGQSGLAVSQTSRPHRSSSREDRSDRQSSSRYPQSARPTTQDFERSADELIAEFVKQDNRGRLAVLFGLLRAKALDEAQVAKLIETADKSRSQAKKIYLWQVLFYSQSHKAAVFLEKELGPDQDEGSILQFLKGVYITRADQVPLLSRIYQANNSSRVRDVILDIASGAVPRPRILGDERLEDENSREESQTLLLVDLFQHSKDAEERRRLMPLAFPRMLKRPQYEADIKKIVTESPSREDRIAAYKAVLAASRPETLDWLLRIEKDPKVQLAALCGFYETLDRSGQIDRFWTGEQYARMLRAGVQEINDAEVEQEIKNLLDTMRKKAVAGALFRYKERLRMLDVVAMHNHGQPPPFANPGEERDDVIASLKLTFGPLPEEGILRNQIEDVRSQFNDKMQKLRERAAEDPADSQGHPRRGTGRLEN